MIRCTILELKGTYGLRQKLWKERFDMLAVKTDKSTRFYCFICKAVMLVRENSDQMFIAVCPNFETSETDEPDNYPRFPRSKLVTCHNCLQSYQPRGECLDYKNTWRCPYCKTLVIVLANQKKSPMIEEVLRIFEIYPPTPWEYANAGLGGFVYSEERN